MKANDGNKTEYVKEEKVEQIQTDEKKSTKGGCLVIVVIGVVVTSLIAFL